MQRIKEILKKIFNENIPIVFILLSSICVCIPLLNSKIDITYDDGIQHICRLMGTFQSITEGQSFPVIMSNFCNGFGYSWNIFYSPLTAYLPLIFKIFNFTFTNCIKVFIFLVVFLSGFTMYNLVKSFTKNKIVATIASIIYIFAPYRLTDMYIRNALAELTSFIFIPMIFHGIYNILKKKKSGELILILGTSGLILTHTIITMYTAIFAVIYLLFNIKLLKDKKILLKLFCCIILILFITSFFWCPLLEHKMATQYEVFKEGRMERTEVLIALKLNFYELLYTPSYSIMIFSIGFISIIGLIITPMAIKKIKNSKYKNTSMYRIYIFSLIAGIVSLIMTLKIFPFEKLPPILKMLQFSFRMLEFSSFFLSIVIAINLKFVSKKLGKIELLITFLIILISTIPYVSHLRYIENYNEDILWPAVPLTSNVSRVHAGMASMEYLPSKAFENRKYIETRSDEVMIMEGYAYIEKQEKVNTNLNCKLTNVIEGTKLELPYIYYLGYEATLEQEENIIKLETYETEKGFIGVTLPTTKEGKLTIKYVGTKIMKISRILSLVSILVFIMLYISNRNRLTKRRN